MQLRHTFGVRPLACLVVFETLLRMGDSHNLQAFKHITGRRNCPRAAAGAVYEGVNELRGLANSPPKLGWFPKRSLADVLLGTTPPRFARHPS